MTYLQLLEQLRSRDDDFRRSRVDQAVLEAHKNIPIRQESTVPPYARRIIQGNRDSYWNRSKAHINRFVDLMEKGDDRRFNLLRPKKPDALDNDTLGERRENEIVLTDEPRMRSYDNREYGMSREQLTTHELRHKALNDMGIKHKNVDHHDYIDVMENTVKPPQKYKWMTDPRKSDKEKDMWAEFYERRLRKNARKNYYLDLLRRMGYEY